MAMTDPIADLLTRLRNASSARHSKVVIPWSRTKEQVARVLSDEGYIRDVVVSGEAANKTMTLLLRYSETGEPVIVGIKRVSKPGLRVYRGSKDVPRVRQGLGVSILTTPEGVLADREARRRNVGGEVICEVW